MWSVLESSVRVSFVTWSTCTACSRVVLFVHRAFQSLKWYFRIYPAQWLAGYSAACMQPVDITGQMSDLGLCPLRVLISYIMNKASIWEVWSFPGKSDLISARLAWAKLCTCPSAAGQVEGTGFNLPETLERLIEKRLKVVFSIWQWSRKSSF